MRTEERLSEPLLGGAAQEASARLRLFSDGHPLGSLGIGEEVAALCIPDFTVEPALLLVNTEAMRSALGVGAIKASSAADSWF